jgi:hypothetical protein
MTRPFTTFDRALLVAAALLGACACGDLDNCPDGADEPIVISDRTSDPENASYESAPWNQLDYFPAKTALIFEHGLGVTPKDVTPYLSFSKVGTADADHGSVTTSAGNQSLIDCVDSKVIVVRNDTCERSFYIRVTADGVGTDLGDVCRK